MTMKEHMELVRSLNTPKPKVKKTKKNESK